MNLHEDFEDETVPVECVPVEEWDLRLIRHQLNHIPTPKNTYFVGWEDWMRLDETGVFERHLQRLEDERDES
jgi:hypothetical protein